MLSLSVAGEGPWRRQTLLSRCWIATAQGPQALYVPIRQAPSGSPYSLLKTLPPARWVPHWCKALQTAYGRSPYFPYLMPELAELLQALPTEAASLSELRQSVQDWVARWLGLPPDGTAFENGSFASAALTPGEFHPKAYCPPQFQPLPYLQAFPPFQANLSILDLLMQLGPEATTHLRRCWQP